MTLSRALILALSLTLLAACGKPGSSTVEKKTAKAAPAKPAPAAEEPKEERDAAAEMDVAKEPEKKEDPAPSTEPPANVDKAPKDAIRGKHGVAWKVVRPGTGVAKPGRDDIVWVHYVAWKSDGKVSGNTFRKRKLPRQMAMAKALPKPMPAFTAVSP